jgi:nucleotide-binding universal stress UspA family protein
MGSNGPEQRALNPADAPIVTGVDMSEATGLVLDSAAQLAEAVGRPLVVVHVVALHAGAGGLVPGRVGGAVVELADACHLECELLLVDADLDWSFEAHFGDVASELRRAARRHRAAALVVGASQGHHVRMLRGPSVPRRLTRDPDRPVVIVPLSDPCR